MARAKALVPANINFHARLTVGEWRAVDELITRHSKALADLGAGGGNNAAAWFRTVVRRLAAEQGIKVDDGASSTKADKASVRLARTKPANQGKIHQAGSA